MPPSAQGLQRPRLEHRASQTIIDLTDDLEDDIFPIQAGRARVRTASLRPPHLSRSDAVALEQVIDLTEDNGEAELEPEIQVTGARELPRPAAQPRLRLQHHPAIAPRDDSPGLFVPADPPQNHHHHHHHHHARAGRFPGAFLVDFFRGARNHNAPNMVIDNNNFPQLLQDLDAGQINVQQAMPGLLNYQHAAFEPRKPDHVAPPAAQTGFTRSPVEGDTVICPSCEEELIHKKDGEDDLVMKKTGKAPTKKEREEHPFWVVKECGHVYCNRCYQNRQPSAKSPVTVGFRQISKQDGRTPKKATLCAVEECESDVRNKDKWVGVFL